MLNHETPRRSTKGFLVLKPVKRFQAASIGALLAVAATLSAHALPINNGGFETGGLAGWSTTAVFNGGVTSAEAYSGSYSLEMDAVDIVYQDLTTLKRFGRLTFKAKADAPITTGVAYATVDYADGSSSEVMFGGGCLSSGDWTAFELALDSTKRVIRVSFSVGESTPIYIDNVALIGP